MKKSPAIKPKKSTAVKKVSAAKVPSRPTPKISSVHHKLRAFFKANWIGTVVIVAATFIFFLPLITRISSYSEGGDAMFNAWTLSRNHHCLLRQSCPSYKDANIFFPNKDTMLYSETQLSAGVVTLPLHFINDNPIFANNVLTVVSFFFAGWFMYLLAKFLSKGHELVSVLAGLAFEFAPYKMAGIFHLQNLCIFGLPLAVLFILKYVQKQHRKYLVGLLLILLYVFFASWYQMVFLFAALVILLAGLLYFRLAGWRPVLTLSLVILVAAAATLPLAKQYIRFSKLSGGTLTIAQETLYSSSVADYFTPQVGTVAGKIYHHVSAHGIVNAYNLDSYSYHGVVLYLIAGLVIVLSWHYRKRTAEWRQKHKLVMILAVIGMVGLFFSLGPLLKVKGSYSYAEVSKGYRLAVPMPYLLVNKFLPQLKFIRAVGRWSILFLFALCCMLALFPAYLKQLKLSALRERLIYGLIVLLAVVELMPLHLLATNGHAYSYNLRVPAVYHYVAEHPEVNNIVVIRYDYDYPGAPIPIAQAEDVLWSGYHNRNIFNGYSGYVPTTYDKDYITFKAFSDASVTRMKELDLRYVLVDKQLSTSKPELADDVQARVPNKVYEDGRYALFKL